MTGPCIALGQAFRRARSHQSCSLALSGAKSVALRGGGNELKERSPRRCQRVRWTSSRVLTTARLVRGAISAFYPQHHMPAHHCTRCCSSSHLAGCCTPESAMMLGGCASRCARQLVSRKPSLNRALRRAIGAAAPLSHIDSDSHAAAEV